MLMSHKEKQKKNKKYQKIKINQNLLQKCNLKNLLFEDVFFENERMSA